MPSPEGGFWTDLYDSSQMCAYAAAAVEAAEADWRAATGYATPDEYRAGQAASIPEDVAKDAERYRWLRDEDRWSDADVEDGSIYVRQVQMTSSVLTGSWVLVAKELDEGVDAMMSAAPTPPKEDES